MTQRKWNAQTAKARIEARLAEVKDLTVKDYVRVTDLERIPRNTAYRVDGVHVYVDILNMESIVASTDVEGTRTHQRTLRFLNLLYRAVARILAQVDAIHVDFHNQRLHAVVAKPYDDEVERLHRAVAMAQLIIDVLGRQAEQGDDALPAAKIRVGIDSGEALAVNNGRPGAREPLFLGPAANLAAKRAAGNAAGIYVTDNVRAMLGWDAVEDEDATALTAVQIEASQVEADLDVTADDIWDAWVDDLEKNPIGRFEFSAHTPPYATLDLDALGPSHARRQDALSLYADIDGFTQYVADHIDSDADAEDVVRVLHVLRSELDAVLTSDFQGAKIRFIGDCIHGALVEGTAQTTDAPLTTSNAIACAGALRSSFELAKSVLAEQGIACDLGLAIGIEYGPLVITRLGIKGDLIRCAVGRGVLASEKQQLRCSGRQTALGPVAYGHAPEWARTWFGTTRRQAGVTYEEVVARRTQAEKGLAKSATAPSLLRPVAASAAAAASASLAFPAHSGVPTKPQGFA
ncbi:adenylate/guanylate cyclase domain-containing protein [Luteimonas sp. MJ250]|uniref:adenylate/guanylate cyclase domain-containing protein n=1 Tax=Luteimonas sp. MJ250 TaxID=3129236 RepID=UPI0031BBA5FE